MNAIIGKYLIVIGIIFLIAGFVWYFFGVKLNWIGYLPGDFLVEKENFRFYFLLTTLLIFSVILNALVRIIRYFL